MPDREESETEEQRLGRAVGYSLDPAVKARLKAKQLTAEDIKQMLPIVFASSDDIEAVVAYEVSLHDARRRPKGSYNPECVIPLDRDLRKHMQDATREDLLAWRKMERSPANLEYIRSRLDLWEAHPECRTLGELEAAR